MHLRVGMVVISLVVLDAATCCAKDAASPFLTNMPQNSNQRCVGIAGVAEALLEGQPDAAKEVSLDMLAQQIYQNFVEAEPLAYPTHFLLSDDRLSIDGKAALTALSDRVAELYKADHHRLSRTPEGVQQLFQAQAEVVRSVAELDRILDADSDKIVFFCCFGQRTFPDRKLRDTNHAVLMRRAPNDGYVVYDPNDPGSAIRCEVEETSSGLAVSWQCRYRDEGIETAQRYFIVPQAKFFKSLQ